MEQLTLQSKIKDLPEDFQAEVNRFVEKLILERQLKIQRKKPVFGCAKGEIYVAPDFDEPLADFKEYM
jgi:hypothetical protein